MNAEQFLNEALGGNMNISTLKPLAWHEIMASYAQHKIKEVAHSASDNTASLKLPDIGSVLNEVFGNDQAQGQGAAYVRQTYDIIVRQLQA